MVDPYGAGMFSFNPYADKRDVVGKLAVVLRGRLENRGLSLVTPISRAVCKNDIHELILTDEAGAAPGKSVQGIAYVGFVEIITGGILVAGDEVVCEGNILGKISGFDETHLPNHLNIVIVSHKRLDGVQLGLALEAEVRFKQKRDGDG